MSCSQALLPSPWNQPVRVASKAMPGYPGEATDGNLLPDLSFLRREHGATGATITSQKHPPPHTLSTHFSLNPSPMETR